MGLFAASKLFLRMAVLVRVATDGDHHLAMELAVVARAYPDVLAAGACLRHPAARRTHAEIAR